MGQIVRSLFDIRVKFFGEVRFVLVSHLSGTLSTAAMALSWIFNATHLIGEQSRVARERQLFYLLVE